MNTFAKQVQAIFLHTTKIDDKVNKLNCECGTCTPVFLTRHGNNLLAFSTHQPSIKKTTELLPNSCSLEYHSSKVGTIYVVLFSEGTPATPVSYTHLTLPTIYSV